MSAMDTNPWMVVAARVKEARLHLGLTQQEAAALGGISLATWRLVETGGREHYQALTLVGVARALHWPQDGVERILGGEDPADFTPAPVPPPPPGLQQHPWSTVGLNVRLQRERNRLSLREVASRAGVSVDAWRAMEGGSPTTVEWTPNLIDQGLGSSGWYSRNLGDEWPPADRPTHEDFMALEEIDWSAIPSGLLARLRGATSAELEMLEQSLAEVDRRADAGLVSDQHVEAARAIHQLGGTDLARVVRAIAWLRAFSSFESSIGRGHAITVVPMEEFVMDNSVSVADAEHRALGCFTLTGDSEAAQLLAAVRAADDRVTEAERDREGVQEGPEARPRRGQSTPPSR